MSKNSELACNINRQNQINLSDSKISEDYSCGHGNDFEKIIS